MASARLVLATHNVHKVGELRAILAEAGIADAAVDGVVVTAAEVGAPDVRETGVTFAENALIKARAVARHTGLPAVADDSGLAVDVLGGAPGIFSARWAGQHGDDVANLELLLAQLGDVDPSTAGCALSAPPRSSPRAGARRSRIGLLSGTLLDEPRPGTAGSATTRSWSGRDTDRRRAGPGREERDLTPRQGVPRPRPGNP